MTQHRSCQWIVEASGIRPEKPMIELLDSPPAISCVEVESVINSLSNNKSPGDDNIPAEFLKQLGPTGVNIMRKLVSKIYHRGEWPEDSLLSTKATQCSDFRTISLIEKQLDESQLGFRSGRGTRDAIFMLRIMAGRLIEKQKNLYLCFIDYTKAFDRVNHAKLLEVIEKANIPAHERNLISNLEFLLREALEDYEGVYVNGMNITNLRYADDTVLIATNTTTLQSMVDSLCRKCTEYGMELNAKETKTMCISKPEPDKLTITANGKNLEQKANYLYLGSTISQNSRIDDEVMRSIGLAKAKFWECKEFTRSNINLRRLKVSWKKKVSNAEVLRKARSSRTLLLSMIKKKIKYAGHTIRGSAGSLASTLLEGRIEGSKSRGRPRRKWLDDIKELTDLSDYGAIKRLAENRAPWRPIVANLRIENFKLHSNEAIAPTVLLHLSIKANGLTPIGLLVFCYRLIRFQGEGLHCFHRKSNGHVSTIVKSRTAGWLTGKGSEAFSRGKKA
ncbi:uncharacterized protein LOC125040612 [Penaeus chinensis]|uniref:uncharacterized protein LOC125040612 n=1 Tax=Penaeus chinensis TaxID=139456 RepID=UPI001FB85209|nr:uncharacterized protein LOC125040612 [Penaeus chinensis]